jgi:hypothetical protein
VHPKGGADDFTAGISSSVNVFRARACSRSSNSSVSRQTDSVARPATLAVFATAADDIVDRPTPQILATLQM